MLIFVPALVPCTVLVVGAPAKSGMGTGGYTDLTKLSGGRWKEVANLMKHHRGSVAQSTFTITGKDMQNISTFQNKTYLIYIHFINYFINL